MKISLQLYSIGEIAKENFSHALELTKKVGYQCVEFAGYHDIDAAKMKALLEKYNFYGDHFDGISRSCHGLRECLE